MPVLGNMPFAGMGAQWRSALSVAFETGAHHHGLFRQHTTQLSAVDLAYIRDFHPTAARLLHQDRFFRSFSLYDSAAWSPNIEQSMTLIWTAIEVLFNLGSVESKTKAVASALSKLIGTPPDDEPLAFKVIKDAYRSRSKFVHAARQLDPKAYMQSAALARTAFQAILVNGQLPLPVRDTR
jgi:hypothetical protein